MESFATDPWLSTLMPVLLAPFIGSFLGVVIQRLPAGRPIAWSRSACDTCNTALGATDLVPLLSYAVSRGRCRHCGAAIGRFHPAVELAATVIAGAAALTSPDAGTAWATSLLGWMVLVVAWIALDHNPIRRGLTLALFLALLLAILLAGLLFARAFQRCLPFGLCLAPGIWSVFLWRNGTLG